MLHDQMSPWGLASVKDGPRNLSLNFHQNWVSNSWDIHDMDKCFSIYSKKKLDMPHKWNIFIICMKFCTQKKNYRFLALFLRCQNKERKKHISPALGKSLRIEKYHFPSTGEIPKCWEPLDCFRGEKVSTIKRWSKMRVTPFLFST